MTNPTYIGIDPAIREYGCGVCVVSPDGSLDFPKFKTVAALLSWLFGQHPKEEAPAKGMTVFCIEDSSAQGVFMQKVRGRANAISKGRPTSALMLSMASDVGKNQGASIIIADTCELLYGAENVVRLSPQQKGAKMLVTYFKADTGYNGTVTQDDVDAYYIASKGRFLHTLKNKKR